ncbi:KpsF/GutQ family sugar-phosphate isomerase [Puniceicoccaceae bacterium K14]|nr:KpsF/GutQ family sugar-phosphate isomerase [Puniceicoccaceae bacterium K14]
MQTSRIISQGKRCIDIEKKALAKTSDSIDERFAKVVETLHESLEQGSKLIFSGIGKNAHVCEKLAGTFNSIGAPSCFIDPVRALHGDLGLCCEGDILLGFSNSGETEELLRFISMVKRFDLTTIAVTSKKSSNLAKTCDLLLPYEVEMEACPLKMAPTASTTASMAIGDAVAMVLLEYKAFQKEDFAKYHPGGLLGQALTPGVEKIMRKGDQFATATDTTICKACIEIMSHPNSGSIALVDESGKLSGVLTDGDIRRLLIQETNFLNEPVSKFMTKSPIVISSKSLAVEALKVFEKHRIDDLIVVNDEDEPIGIIDGQDLTKLRVI